MPWRRLTMPSLDWRRPWVWPVAYQRAVWACAAFLGVLLSPWWWQSWQAWDEATAAQEQLLTQQLATQDLQAQTAQWTQAQTNLVFADAAAFTQQAQRQGLQLSHVGSAQPVAASASLMQQLPMQLQVQGAWSAWVAWLDTWPVSAPGVTVAALDLKADAQGGIAAHVVAVLPLPTAAEPPFALAGVDFDGPAAPPDPFNAQSWTQAQRAHAQQHPSYAQLVAPELQRVREPLEAFARERLHYVGQISSGPEREALVKVLPLAGAKKELTMWTIHRVRVGSHVGQNFGLVLVIADEALVVQELVLSATGEWQKREVSLPLYEDAP